MTINDKYTKLSKKHKLPSFEELDKEFEISSIENENFLLREIRRKIAEKIELYIKVLEGFLQPETTLSNMYESKMFNDEERQDMFKLFSELMFLDRLSIETAVDEDDKKSSSYITEAYKGWKGQKSRFAGVIRKAKESWKKDTDVKEELRYIS